jgi:hypothetical protein
MDVWKTVFSRGQWVGKGLVSVDFFGVGVIRVFFLAKYARTHAPCRGAAHPYTARECARILLTFISLNLFSSPPPPPPPPPPLLLLLLLSSSSPPLSPPPPPPRD